MGGTVVTGVLYSSKRSDFNDANASGDPSRFDKRDSAQTLGTVNAVLLGGAAVSAGFLRVLLGQRRQAREPAREHGTAQAHARGLAPSGRADAGR